MTKYANCPYCNVSLANSVYSQHVSVCMFGPMGDRVRAFLRAHARGGRMMTSREYDRRREAGMPLVDSMRRQEFTWPLLAAELGLELGRKHDTAQHDLSSKRWERRLAEVDKELAGAVPARVLDWPLPGKWKVKRYYDWRTRQERQSLVFEMK